MAGLCIGRGGGGRVPGEGGKGALAWLLVGVAYRSKIQLALENKTGFWRLTPMNCGVKGQGEDVGGCFELNFSFSFFGGGARCEQLHNSKDRERRVGRQKKRSKCYIMDTIARAAITMKACSFS